MAHYVKVIPPDGTTETFETHAGPYEKFDVERGKDDTVIVYHMVYV